MKHRRRWLWIAFLTWLVLRLGLALLPMVPRQLDELGYLANARYLVSGEGSLEPAGRAPYKAGYSLLLVPAYWIADDEATAFLLVRCLNAVLLASLLPLAVALARRLDPEIEPVDQLLLGAAVALSPAAVLYGTTAMSEAVLIPGFLAYLLFAQSALGPGRARDWLAWGATAGGLYLVHERAVGWLALALLAAAITALARKHGRPLLLLPPALGVAALDFGIPGSSWSTGRSAAGFLLGTFERLPQLAATVLGQSWYAALASLGVVFAGLWLVALRRKTPFEWLLLASSGSMVALSMIAMGQRNPARITHWLYGRYLEAVLPALVVLAWIALRRAGPRRHRQALGVALLVLGLCPLGLRLLWTPIMGDPYSFNVPALAVYDALAGWGLLRTAGLGLLLGAALLWLAARRYRAALAAFVLWQTVASVAGFFDADWRQRGEWRAREHHLATLVHTLAEDGEIPPDATICYDRQTFPSFHYYHYDFQLPNFELRVADRVAPCDGDLWITPNVTRGPSAGSRLVALETLPPTDPPFQQTLWVRAGDLQDRLDRRRWLLPPDFPVAFEAGALAGRIRRLDSSDGDGDEKSPRIEIEHRGTTPWPHARGLRRYEYRVAVRVTWQPESSAGAKVEATLELPRLLLPGERLVLDLPPPAGDYCLPERLRERLPERRREPRRYRLRVEVDQFLPGGWAEVPHRAQLEEIVTCPDPEARATQDEIHSMGL